MLWWRLPVHAQQITEVDLLRLDQYISICSVRYPMVAYSKFHVMVQLHTYGTPAFWGLNYADMTFNRHKQHHVSLFPLRRILISIKHSALFSLRIRSFDVMMLADQEGDAE